MLNYDEKAIESNISYIFKNKELLKQAMSHSSYVNEMKRKGYQDYERLEFLGDAVLELITSEFLYFKYKDYQEGELTKLRASIVCEFTLADTARKLNLGQYVLLGKGEALSGGQERDSILCDLFEAVLGAIYLDGGMEPASEYVHKFLLSDIENKALYYDSKTTLQEILQKNGTCEINYELLKETGPDHEKKFVVQVLVDGSPLAKGAGKSKKDAQKMAAYNAILKLKESK